MSLFSLFLSHPSHPFVFSPSSIACIFCLGILYLTIDLLILVGFFSIYFLLFGSWRCMHFFGFFYMRILFLMWILLVMFPILLSWFLWFLSFSNTMSKQYWTPTSVQLQVLEYIFNQENKTPNKSRIMQIVSELSLHGQISDMNVYNCFKSRRAHLRRLDLSTQAHNSELGIQPRVQKDKLRKRHICTICCLNVISCWFNIFT